ncbi:MAG TPA: GldG family protein [Burkholderiales bacterium]|nr:GldG family protein [Burkholderiales bacterium]
MEHGPLDLIELAWFAGWLAAVLVLFLAGLRLPLQTRLSRHAGFALNLGFLAAAAAVAVLANVALTLHDVHIDLTREKVYTPSAQAMAVVDNLRQPVKLTYFYRSQDPEGRRVKDVLEVMGRRNALLQIRTIDPDRQPAAAQAYGVRLYNAAVLEAQDRKLLVQSTDEAEIAIGIQRVLREKVIRVCFLEGHGELPMDNFEFHTHVEGVANHSHGDASSQYVQMQGHGIGRLRRALETQGYETRKIVLATLPGVPSDCDAVIDANPRTTFLPGETAALEKYLEGGGSLFAMFDLGFVLEPRLARLAENLGVRLPQEAVVDPLSHYSTDAEMVAITAYQPNPITKGLSMTFFPGVRPLLPGQAAEGVRTTALFASSRDSYSRAVAPVGVREVAAAAVKHAAPSAPGPRVLAVASEGRLPGAAADARAFRVVLVGDGDFASNSFLPYLSNSDLAAAAVRWLVREERATAVTTRIPVPPMILLSGSQMKWIFLLVEGALPLAVFALGFIVWWRRR